VVIMTAAAAHTRRPCDHGPSTMPSPPQHDVNHAHCDRSPVTGHHATIVAGQRLDPVAPPPCRRSPSSGTLW
jgi:hypothetical protein